MRRNPPIHMQSNPSLNFAILITAPPLHSSSTTAFHFLQATLNKNHSVKRVFFYQDGVYHGSRLIYLENALLINRWQNLAKQYDLELTLCSTSAARRGIMGPEQADYFEKDTDNLAEGFQIGSLSLWFESVLMADRVISF